MRKYLQPILKFVKKADPRKLRRLSPLQWLKVAAGLAAVYLVVLGVNLLVLKTQINDNDSRIGGTRRTVDAMSLNFNLASRILDKDLKSQQAIGRVGGFYLTDERFKQLVVTEKTQRRVRNLAVAESNARILTDKVLDRMLIEQLVGEYAREHSITADPADVEKRITVNLRTLKTLGNLETALKSGFNWTLPDFRYEIEYSILKAKMEEALGGKTFEELSKGSLQNASTPKVKDYADNFARTHTNYLVSGGINTLAKRFLEL